MNTVDYIVVGLVIVFICAAMYATIACVSGGCA